MDELAGRTVEEAHVTRRGELVRGGHVYFIDDIRRVASDKTGVQHVDDDDTVSLIGVLDEFGGVGIAEHVIPELARGVLVKVGCCVERGAALLIGDGLFVGGGFVEEEPDVLVADEDAGGQAVGAVPQLHEVEGREGVGCCVPMQRGRGRGDGGGA